MIHLLDNINDEQKAQIRWLMNQWRDREKATDVDGFQVEQKIQEVLSDTGSPFSMVAHVKPKGKPKGGTPTTGNKCGFRHV